MTVIRWKNEAHRLCQPRRCRSRIRDFRFGPINRRHQPRHPATPAGVKAFLEEVDRELLRLINASNRAGWVQSTYITPDTEVIAAQANEALVTAATNYAKDAFTYDKVQVGPVERRQLNLLKNSLTIAAPPDPKEGGTHRLVASMEGSHGSGRLPPPLKLRRTSPRTSASTSRRSPRSSPRTATRSGCRKWEGWHTISVPMRKDYQRFAELSNKGPTSSASRTRARCGAADDMPADEFAKELDRLWDQLRPLYLSLHTYVRAKLHEKYGAAVPENGPIPAHLLGNLWQQDWSNISDIAPPGQKQAFNLTSILKEKKLDAIGMARIGERFFTSLGFEPLPKTFTNAHSS